MIGRERGSEKGREHLREKGGRMSGHVDGVAIERTNEMKMEAANKQVRNEGSKLRARKTEILNYLLDEIGC